MKFSFKNLGYIKEGSLELGNLTVICGDNNTGKTYLTYSLYGFLKQWQNYIELNIPGSLIEELINKGIVKYDLEKLKSREKNLINKLSKKYSENINDIFNSKESFFKNSKFSIDQSSFDIDYKAHIKSDIILGEKQFINLDKPKDSSISTITLVDYESSDGFLDDLPPHGILMRMVSNLISRAFFQDYLPSPVIITAERLGISVFYKELDERKNTLVEFLQKQDSKSELNPFDIIKSMTSRYSQPIKDNIDFIRKIDDYVNQETSFYKRNSESLEKYLDSLTDGEFKITDEEVSFLLNDDEKDLEIPITMGSSSIRSLMNLYFYLKHRSDTNQILIIDEPELNLHPKNQLLIARLLAWISNKGIKVLITTHSDYIVREINNLLMLGNDFENRSKVMKKHKYTEAEVLDSKLVKAYITNNNTIIEADIDEYGIDLKSFDSAIERLNDVTDDILFSLG